MLHKTHRYTHTVKFDQDKIDRLAHIEEIYQNTNGWTKQLFNLYEERKQLQMLCKRMRPEKS